MQAIITRYLPATNTLGSRIKATAEAGSVTIPYPYHLCNWEAHRYAARILCDKLCHEHVTKWSDSTGGGWELPLVSGTLPDGSMAHVSNP